MDYSIKTRFQFRAIPLFKWLKEHRKAGKQKESEKKKEKKIEIDDRVSQGLIDLLV